MTVPPYQQGPWTVETVLTHLTSLLEALKDLIITNDSHVTELIVGNDRRYEQRFIAQALATDAALAAAERAVLKAEASAERRFEGVNEFRATLADQQRTLIPRAEVEVIVKGIVDKIQSVERTLQQSIAERQAAIATIQKTIETMQAEKRGVAGGWGYAVGALGLLLAILGLAARFWKP